MGQVIGSTSMHKISTNMLNVHEWKLFKGDQFYFPLEIKWSFYKLLQAKIFGVTK